MFNYAAYGLAIQANFPISTLSPIKQNSLADLQIHIEEKIALEILSTQFEKTLCGMSQHLEGDSLIHCSWFQGNRGRVEFKINDAGNRISVSLEQATLESAAALLSGRILGLTLRLRGILSLHACVIKVGEGAVAIVGESGAGKSTTAAAMAKRGHAILADDIAALKQQNNRWLVQSGYPRLRLWPNSARELYGTEAGLPKIFNGCNKVFVDLDQCKSIDSAPSEKAVGQFQHQSLPLSAIYVLQQRQPGKAMPAINPVSLPEATMKLMAHRSANNSFTLDAERQSQEFTEIAQLVQTVPVRQVIRSDHLDFLPQLCDAIESDVTQLTESSLCLQH